LERCVAVFWATARSLASASWAVAVVVLFHLASSSSAFASEADDVERAEDALEAAMLETMGISENERDETTSVTAISLGEHAVYGDLWVAHMEHDYNKTIAVYVRQPNGNLGKPLAQRSTYLGLTDGEAINVGISKDVYFTISATAGTLNCDTEVYRFDGEEVSSWTSYHDRCWYSGVVRDLNEDDIDELLFVHEGPTAFHRRSRVFQFSAELAYWSGSKFVMVHPSAPQDGFVERNADAALVGRMVEADLWVDAALLAAELSDQAHDDVSFRWWSALIKEIASLRIDNVSWSEVPFLSAVFAGDYALAFDMMRANFPEMAFSPEGPLIVGTTSEGMFDHVRDEVTEYLLDHTERAMAVRSDNPHILAVRALAMALDSPDDATAALGALERAVALAPQLDWLRQAQSFLRGQ